MVVQFAVQLVVCDTQLSQTKSLVVQGGRPDSCSEWKTTWVVSNIETRINHFCACSHNEVSNLL